MFGELPSEFFAEEIAKINREIFILSKGNPDFIRTFENMPAGEYESHLVTYLQVNQEKEKKEDTEEL